MWASFGTIILFCTRLARSIARSSVAQSFPDVLGFTRPASDSLDDETHLAAHRQPSLASCSRWLNDDVDDRDKPGHDGYGALNLLRLLRLQIGLPFYFA
jgi:hypothetical protein